MSQISPENAALHPLLAEALRKKGYDTLTAVQAAVADPKLASRDMLVSSRTGSGKTVAYGLGMASGLLSDTLPEGHEAASSFNEGRALPPAGKPLALIIAPTRELALQVQRELRWLYAETGAIITTCVGGMDQRAERKHLERGVHIVVGTPGRLVDHLTRKALVLDELAVAVLDEADEMLDLGFREDLETILAATPEGRRTLLFSATLPKGIVALATHFQRNAARIEVASDSAGHVDIEHRAAMVKPFAIEHGVVNLLRQSDSPAALVFCNTRDAVRHLHATLIERGFSAVTLSGEMGQHDRNQALQALRDGRAKICIATDVAARGIDLPNLGLVIHADLPHDSEVLQHRSGRTGRAGRKGVSVMLVPPSRRSKALRLFAESGTNPNWIALPTADEIRTLDRERMLADAAPFTDLTEFDRDMGLALLAARPAEEIAAALAGIFRSRLPEPEEIDPIPPEEFRLTKKGKAPLVIDQPQEYRWFELNVGRHDKAEPKGVLRMLTRAGGVERRFIGAIRIHDATCHVEIAVEVAERFERKHANPGPDDIRVRPIDQPAAKPKRKFERKDTRAEKEPRPEGERASPQEKPSRFDTFAKTEHRKGRKPEGRAVEERAFEGRKQDRMKSERAKDERARPDGEGFAKKPFEKKPFGKKPFGEKTYGEKKFGEKNVEGRRNYDGSKPLSRKPDGKRKG